MRKDYVLVTNVDVGSMLDVDLVLLVAGPVLMVRCLAGVDDAVEGLDVVGLLLYVVLRYVAESQLIPEPSRFERPQLLIQHHHIPNLLVDGAC